MSILKRLGLNASREGPNVWERGPNKMLEGPNVSGLGPNDQFSCQTGCFKGWEGCVRRELRAQLA